MTGLKNQNPLKYSRRVTSIDISGIRKMFENAGPDAINMGLGQPDFDTPQNIKDAAIRAINEGKTGYTNNAGLDELRLAVCDKLKRENGLEYEKENVLITAGGSGALHAAIVSLIENGDKVVFNDPGFVSYGSLARLAEGVPDPVALRPDLHLDVDALSEKFSDPKVKLFVLNNPANPTGMVESPETVKAVVESAADSGVTVISDEVYEKFCYDNAKFVSAAKFGDNVITINATSKTYAMTGWRVGFMACDKEIISQAVKIQQYSLACPNSIAQYAAIEAYNGPQDSVVRMKNEYEMRRNLLVKGLEKIGFKVHVPQGAFYLFPEIHPEIIMRIINNGVIITPGTAFGGRGIGHARLCYSTSQENISKALERIENAVTQNGN